MTLNLEGVYVVVTGKMATSGQGGPGRLGLT
jgi:hypothetical protein